MYIQKILEYDVYVKTTGTARYQHVLKLLNQSIDPETLHPNSLDCGQQATLTSPRKRAISCIKKDSTLSISVSPALNEIAFSLQDFCSEKDFLTDGSTAVRRAFVQAFIENKLKISHQQLQKELEGILALSTQVAPPLSISHTFRIKLLELYARIGNTLFQDPTTISNHIDCKKHFYEFGEIIEI